MKTSLITLLSAALFLTGISYLYYPEFVVKAVKWLKQKLFNEENIPANRKKIGMLYILFSFLVVYTGIIAPKIANFSSEQAIKSRLNLSWQYYYQGKYADAEKESASVLEKDVNNASALEQMCIINFTRGDYEKAEFYCMRVLRKDPENKKIKNIYEKSASKHSRDGAAAKKTKK